MKALVSSKKQRGKSLVALLLIGALLFTLVAACLPGCSQQHEEHQTEPAASTGAHTEPVATTGPMETMEPGTEPAGLGEG